MHQGMGLEAFNALSRQKAVHALYECCNSVTLAGDLADQRPYASHTALFRRADALLFALPEAAVERILDAYPHIGARPGSARSAAEQCAVWDADADLMADLNAAADAYAERFGFGFVMCCAGGCSAGAVLAAIADRMHNDDETERKVVRNELAKINRTRLERMLGPEGGFQNYW